MMTKTDSNITGYIMAKNKKGAKRRKSSDDLGYVYGTQGKKSYVVMPSITVSGVPRISQTPLMNLRKAKRKLKVRLKNLSPALPA